MSETLSVVMPVHNEAAHLPETMEALVRAVEGSGFEAELVLVDDGSVDGSATAVRDTLRGRVPVNVVTQPNRGRFAARRAGLETAAGDWVLFLDGRVRLRPTSLAHVHPRLQNDARVWNGHVYVDAGSPYGTFWKLLAELAWRDYFDDPRETSYAEAEFDRYPKGTTCFLAPRELMLEGLTAFRSYYEDPRKANDDTPLIRWLAGRERIHLSPNFACDYAPRSTFRTFVRHALHRGTVFLDGHGRRESRFFPAVLAFFPVSAALALAVLRRPRRVLPLAVAGGVGGAAYAASAGRSPSESATFGALTPVYVVAHGAGMWAGLVLAVRSWARRRRRA